MEYRSINGTDLALSVMGTGCWIFGGGDYWGALDQKDATDVVHASLACGINYFDTAEVYNEGRSESSLGLAIKGIPRDKMIIGTKISPSNTYPGIIEQHCDESLRRLQTDYIDIYMVHWPIHPHSLHHFTSDESIISHPPSSSDAFESLVRLQQAGKIRYIGVSNFGARRLMEDIPEKVQVAVNELPYNPLCRAIEYDVLPLCLRKGIGVIGYMTLLQGILTGEFASLDEIPPWQRRTRHFNSAGSPLARHGESGFETETTAAWKGMEEITVRHGIKLRELAIRWTIGSGITCALVGAKTASQLEENVKALDLEFNAEIKAEVDQVTCRLKEKMGNHIDYYESRENDRTI